MLEEMKKAVPKILMQDLRKQAKVRGLKGYLTLSKFDLKLLLAGKPVPKKMKKTKSASGSKRTLDLATFVDSRL